MAAAEAAAAELAISDAGGTGGPNFPEPSLIDCILCEGRRLAGPTRHSQAVLHPASLPPPQQPSCAAWHHQRQSLLSSKVAAAMHGPGLHRPSPPLGRLRS